MLNVNYYPGTFYTIDINVEFEYAYDALVRVLARKTPAAGPPQPSVNVTPPSQTTVPADPNVSGSTTSMAS